MFSTSNGGGGGQSFNVGRRIITTKKGQQQQQAQQPFQQPSEVSTEGRRRPQVVRQSIKDARPVSVSTSAFGSSTGGNEEGSGKMELSSGTEQRRRVVEVRQRNKREAEQQARRAQAVAPTISGFNTGRDHSRRAQVVLPKNSEKMAAREALMQMHPHIAQLFRGVAPPEQFVQEPFNRILTAEAPTMPYRRRQQEIKSTVQWGERRLFLYELEFLTQYASRPNTVVIYAGCAPGTRLSFLAELFPAVSFVCVDPTPLDVDESLHPNVRTRVENFNDALARELQAGAEAEGRTLLFIANATSDAPLGGLVTEQSTNEHAFSAAALAQQQRWYTLLRPAKALLKFSLPWTDDDTHYLDGDIICPVWNPPTSTEMRLVPNEFRRTWSHRHFEEQCMHFNVVTRVSLHEHGVTAEGIDGCYDCTSEVFILERYLERYPHMLSVAVGSQLTVTPAASKPATQLRLDSTRFNDPKWLAQQREREARHAPKIKIVIEREEEGKGADQAEAQAAPAGDDADMGAENAAAAGTGAAASPEAASPSAAAAAASPDAAASASPAASSEFATAAAGDAAAAAAAGGASSEMGDAAPGVELTPLEQLKVNVGKFSQELSRRLTKGGTRTLATVNEAVIKKAAFSRKNRL